MTDYQPLTLAEVLDSANVTETPTGCKLWRHAKASTGYGLISEPYTREDGEPARRMVGVHRVVWNLAHPADPIQPGQDIRRNFRCSGNKLCIEPSHLVKETRATYLPAGAQAGAAKHSTEQIAILKRWLIDKAVTQAEAARRIGELSGVPMSRSNVNLIAKEKIWANIEPASAELAYAEFGPVSAPQATTDDAPVPDGVAA